LNQIKTIGLVVCLIVCLMAAFTVEAADLKGGGSRATNQPNAIQNKSAAPGLNQSPAVKRSDSAPDDLTNLCLIVRCAEPDAPPRIDKIEGEYAPGAIILVKGDNFGMYHGSSQLIFTSTSDPECAAWLPMMRFTIDVVKWSNRVIGLKIPDIESCGETDTKLNITRPDGKTASITAHYKPPLVIAMLPASYLSATCRGAYSTNHCYLDGYGDTSFRASHETLRVTTGESATDNYSYKYGALKSGWVFE
jgi:hypothetical protein